VLILAAITAVVAGGAWFLESGSRSGEGPVRVGGTAPDFPLERFGGERTHLSELDGKLFLVNFWATCCEGCIIEMPSILRLRERFESRGLRLVLINLDQNPSSVLPDALPRLGLSDLPIYLDPENRVAEIFDVQAIPLTAILNKEGEVFYLAPGEK